MGIPFGCKCHERKKPAADRAWVVTQYKWNSGAFVKAGGEPSRYSQILCLRCGASGRSKAKYVEKLRIMKHEDAYRELDRFRDHISTQPPEPVKNAALAKANEYPCE